MIANQTIRLDTLQAHKSNYNLHSDDQIRRLAKSLATFGQARSIVVWRPQPAAHSPQPSYTILAGHGVVEAARSLGWTELRADVLPDDWPEAKALAYLVADNELARRSDPDQAQLAAILEELQAREPVLVEAAGYTNGELEALLRLVRPPAPVDAEPQLDRASELQQKWGTATGQLWACGEHRLICGDCTDAAVVARLMGGERAALMATDPPYGVDFEGAKYNPRAKAWDGIEGDKIQGADLKAWLEKCLRVWFPHMQEDAAFYLWTAAMEEGAAAAAAIRASGLHIQSQIIWNKNTLVLGQADYQWKHENCWYAFWKGNQHRWFGGRAQTTVWDISKIANGAYQHPMQKPVELYGIAIENHTLPGEICAEPFSGSGTTLIACENLGRRCRAIEISPAYVAVALERFATATGKQPHLLEYAPVLEVAYHA